MIRRVYTPPLLSMAGAGCGRFYVLAGPEGQIVEVDLIMAGRAYLQIPDHVVVEGADQPRTPRRPEDPGRRHHQEDGTNGGRPAYLRRALIPAIISRQAPRPEPTGSQEGL